MITTTNLSGEPGQAPSDRHDAVSPISTIDS